MNIIEKGKLTRKELVEQIRESMPSDYNEYERLAFIEREVAKQISFDEKYLWGDIGTKEKMYELAKKEAQKPSKQIKRKLICVTMAELFGYVAKQFGYDVKYQKRAPGTEIKSGENEIFNSISNKKQQHICPVIGLSNGQFIEVDIQDDLARLQTRSKPKAFGNAIHEIQIKIGILDKSLVENTFKKIYHLEENERFTDEYIMVFSAMLRCQYKSPIEMLEFFMDDPRIQEELKNTRCKEANGLYKYILKLCYDISDGTHFIKDENQAIIEECVLSDNENKKRYSFCIYAEDSEQKVLYVYSKKSRRMVKLNQAELQQMLQQNKDIKLRGRQSELKDKMLAFINDVKENATISKTGQSNISLEDIFVDEEEL